MAVVGPLELVAALSDDELKERITELSRRESRSTAALIAHLSEFEARKLYRAQACASTFSYCVQVLHLSEHAAYDRIAAARAVRRFPSLLDCLVDGSLHLSAISLICPLLTEANYLSVIDSARYRSKREIERLVATLRPLPSAADMIRRLPVARLVAVDPIPFGPAPSDSSNAPLLGGPGANSTTNPAATPAWTSGLYPSGHDVLPNVPQIAPQSAPQSAPPPAPPLRVIVLPLGPDRFRVQFTASAELHEKLRRAQAFLRHQIPDGDLARVFDRALTLLLDHVERRKIARRGGRPEGESKPQRLLPAESTRRPLAGTAIPGSAETNQPVPAVELASTPAATMSHTAMSHTATSHADDAPFSTRSRHVPAAVRRAVWHRDQGQCAFHDTLGRRCQERGHLEFHHVEPFARGGEATEMNIQVRCRVHNQYESELLFGTDRWTDGAPVRT